MPGKPTSGNRTALRGKPTRVRRRLSKAAAARFDKEFAWATEDAQDAILSELVLHAPRELWDVIREITQEMGIVDGQISDDTGKPIIL